MKAIEKAASGFDRGLSCSQSMVDGFAEQYGYDAEAARRLGRAFGSGMGMGSVCGAVTGALMVLGMAQGDAPGDNGEQEARNRSYDLAREFVRRLETRHGSIQCLTLVGVDLSRPEGQEEAEQKGLFDTICQPLLKSAAEILDGILVENGYTSKNNF